MSHAIIKDCHELLQQLRAPRKPCKLKVQAFYYCLKELNPYVAWMPGNEVLLNDENLSTPFMVQCHQLGANISYMPAVVVHYFRKRLCSPEAQRVLPPRGTKTNPSTGTLAMVHLNSSPSARTKTSLPSPMITTKTCGYFKLMTPASSTQDLYLESRECKALFPLRVLFDSGSDHSLIVCSVIPRGATSKMAEPPYQCDQ